MGVAEMPSEDEINHTNADDTEAIYNSINVNIKFT